MEFGDLPNELVLKIFSYLPQRYLPAIAEVSYRWMQAAFDPLLWTEVTFTPSGPSSAEHITDILDRASLLRKLDVSHSVVDLDAVAKASHRFGLLNELMIENVALEHHAMPQILRSCKSLTTMVVKDDALGRTVLSESQVAVLEMLPCLKSLLTSHKIKVSDIAFRQVCLSCPRLEELKINSSYILESSTWNFLTRLPHLTSLSVTELPKDALVHLSKCPSLEALKAYARWNVYEILTAEVLRRFANLKCLKLKGYVDSDWLTLSFCIPNTLECLDISGVTMGKADLEIVVRSGRFSMQHLAINITKITHATLEILSAFDNLESICICGVSGDHMILPILCKLPKLVRAKLYVEENAICTLLQLRSVVDVSEISPRGNARVILNLVCVSRVYHDAMVYVLRLFKTFLASRTSLSDEHIRDLEKQMKLPCRGFQRSVKTSFSVESKTLKYLVLNLYD